MKFGFSICFALALLSSCATKVAVEENHDPLSQTQRYLFTIDGNPTYADEFLYILNKNNQIGEEKKDFTSEEFEKNLDLFINFKLKVAEAERLGYHQTEEFRREFDSFREDLRRPYLLENEVQEGELQKAYDRLQEIVKASHILLSFPTDATLEDSIAVMRMAEKIRNEAVSGVDFADLAVEHSQDPSVQVNKGNLGYFTAMQMVYPFEAAAYDLKIGEVSSPVATDFGYHIIRLEDRKPNPGEVRVSHLLVRTVPGDAASEDRAVRRIADIYAQLRLESSTWEGVVASFSEDQGTRESGGLLPWFGVGSIVPEFEAAAFGLTEIGEISPPVKTDYGYHIIRLEGTRPVPPYEEMEAILKSRILRDSRSTLIASQVMAMQKAKYKVSENELLIRQLSESFGDWSGNVDVLEDTINRRDLWKLELLSISGESLLLQDFFDFVKSELEAVQSPRINGFEAWYERFVTKRLKEEEERDLLENNAEYRMLVREFREGILLFSLMNDKVWQMGIFDSIGQHQYYETHMDRYQWKDRVPALVISFVQKNPEEQEKIRQFLSGKQYAPELKNELEKRWLEEFPLLFTMEDKLQEIPTHPLIKDLDISTSFHEVTKDGKQFFVMTGELIPAQAKKFEEIRGLVIQDYQNFLDENLIGELRNKSILQVDEEEKKRVYEIAVN
ncbi:Foldase protein PrsA precursor [Lunatimonas lonarensis]|uniref:Foldase protein PrsA n=1 Tax=Lunatimonas lonarensis TaxID=1232681 RepID=R7ZTM0_9BACT|nr:peptidylprolyl isomerase [Lunatimonas lonarensis]EON77344.1 Foldase protein PrsA precursor [Lunatimonas lonarensis]